MLSWKRLLQSKEGCSGASPLFKLRLTHLGDGSSLLTASWSHALTDGKDLGCARDCVTCILHDLLRHTVLQ